MDRGRTRKYMMTCAVEIPCAVYPDRHPGMGARGWAPPAGEIQMTIGIGSGFVSWQAGPGASAGKHPIEACALRPGTFATPGSKRFC